MSLFVGRTREQNVTRGVGNFFLLSLSNGLTVCLVYLVGPSCSSAEKREGATYDDAVLDDLGRVGDEGGDRGGVLLQQPRRLVRLWLAARADQVENPLHLLLQPAHHLHLVRELLMHRPAPCVRKYVKQTPREYGGSKDLEFGLNDWFIHGRSWSSQSASQQQKEEEEKKNGTQ